MLILALARRQNKKLLDALDILVNIEDYFPKNVHPGMKLLKSVWYEFMAKLFMEIKDKEQR